MPKPEPLSQFEKEALIWKAKDNYSKDNPLNENEIFGNTSLILCDVYVKGFLKEAEKREDPNFIPAIETEYKEYALKNGRLLHNGKLLPSNSENGRIMN